MRSEKIVCRDVERDMTRVAAGYVYVKRGWQMVVMS